VKTFKHKLLVDTFTTVDNSLLWEYSHAQIVDSVKSSIGTFTRCVGVPNIGGLESTFG